VCYVAMVFILHLIRLSASQCEELLPIQAAGSRFKSKRSTIAILYTWPPDDGLKMRPKHVEAW
jgi:hypothetical protein